MKRAGPSWVALIGVGLLLSTTLAGPAALGDRADGQPRHVLASSEQMLSSLATRYPASPSDAGGDGLLAGALTTVACEQGGLAQLETRCADWIARFDEAAGTEYGVDVLAASALSADGKRLFLAGTSQTTSDPDPTGENMAIGAIDTDTGAVLWGARFDWETYAGSDDGWSEDTGFDVAVDNVGEHVFVVGRSRDSSISNTTTVAFDQTTGEEAWVALGPSVSRNALRLSFQILASHDGATVYLSSRVDEPDNRALDEMHTIAYDAETGAERWHSVYDPTFWEDAPEAMTLSADGEVLFVTGGSVALGPSQQFGDVVAATIAYATDTGEALWVSRSNPSLSFDIPQAIATDDAGERVFVTAVVDSQALGVHLRTFAYDAGTGEQLWEAFYAGTGTAVDAPTAIEVAPDGSQVFVTGFSGGGDVSGGYLTGFDTLTLAYNASSGEQTWVHRYDRQGCDDHGWDLAPSQDGSTLYVVGYSRDAKRQDHASCRGLASQDAAQPYLRPWASTTLALDPLTGEHVWTSVYHTAATSWLDSTEIHLSPDGSRVHVTAQDTQVLPDADQISQDMAALTYPATGPSWGNPLG